MSEDPGVPRSPMRMHVIDVVVAMAALLEPLSNGDRKLAIRMVTMICAAEGEP